MKKSGILVLAVVSLFIPFIGAFVADTEVAPKNYLQTGAGEE